jgi:hypothetical protein
MIWLATAVAAIAAGGFLYFRVRSRIRWRRMIDAYADRQIARQRRTADLLRFSLHKTPGNLTGL